MCRSIYKVLIFLMPIAGCMLSCDRQRSRPIYNSVVIDDSSVANDDEAEFSEEVHIPFKIQGGVKTIPVKVNGIGFEMIFDTGCSAALISVAEAQYLYSKGLLTDDDFIDTELNMIADGSIVENMVVNLREVVIGDKLTATDVKATVSSNINAPLLIGNSVLDRVGALTIDNANQELIFHLSD